MRCSRNSCENILCNTYIPSVGYVCSECKEQFKTYVVEEKINTTKWTEIIAALERFLLTDKILYEKYDQINIDDFFNKYTE